MSTRREHIVLTVAIFFRSALRLGLQVVVAVVIGLPDFDRGIGHHVAARVEYLTGKRQRHWSWRPGTRRWSLNFISQLIPSSRATPPRTTRAIRCSKHRSSSAQSCWRAIRTKYTPRFNLSCASSGSDATEDRKHVASLLLADHIVGAIRWTRENNQLACRSFCGSRIRFPRGKSYLQQFAATM